MLPAQLPSSIEFFHGYVKYAVCVVLEIPNRFNKKFKQPFTVSSVLNLNDDLALRVSISFFLQEWQNNNLFKITEATSYSISIVKKDFE